MATATSAFYIGGVQLLPYHIHIEQRSDWHHEFEVTVSTEKAKVMGGVGATESVIIDNAIAHVGEVAEISIARSVGSLQFNGYITNVRMDQVYAGDSFIIFSGYSPTYLLDGQTVMNSYEEKTLKDIFSDCLSDFPANIKQEVKPRYNKPIPYVVQYKETHFDFLRRLAVKYGEWFYFDGQKIVFGELPSKNPKADLKLGSDSMLSFNYGIHLKPANFAHKYYKYQDNDVLEHKVGSYEPGWLDPHSKTAHKASQELFKKEEVDLVDHEIKDQSHLKAVAEAQKDALLSNVILFNGQSANPSIVVGAEIKVSSRNGLIGEYRVVSVSHTVDSGQDYYNAFQAIPITSVKPPLDQSVIEPRADSQIAEVVENSDPDKLGRVRVKCKWQEGLTPWIRVLTGMSGGTYGQYFIPEIGDEVLLGFENGNPDKPYVAGAKYHGKIPPEFSDPDNNMKAIKTRSGHTLLFNDQDGSESITIKDKNGNTINLDTSGKTISMSSDSAISISSNDITVSANNNITLSAKNDITLSADNNVKITAKNQTNISGDSAANFVSKGSSVGLTPADGKLIGKGKLDLSSNGTMKIGANGPVEVRGATIKLN